MSKDTYVFYSDVGEVKRRRLNKQKNKKKNEKKQTLKMEEDEAVKGN